VEAISDPVNAEPARRAISLGKAAAQADNAAGGGATGAGMGRVFDCFTFFNELDLLDIRLHEHAPAVHRFVLAEATLTHAGHPKPLYFAENRDRFAPFLDRIIHIVVDDVPTEGVTQADNLRREIHHRNALSRGLAAARPDDFMLLSDLDEIVRADAIKSTVERPGLLPTVHCFELRWFYYFLNYEKPRRWGLGCGPRMTRIRHGWMPQELRDTRLPDDDRPLLRRMRWMRRRHHRLSTWTVHRDAGWHFSYMGGLDAVIQKLNAYHHIHPEAYKERSYLARCILEGRSYDPTDPDQMTLRPIDESFPSHVCRNPDSF
jgi:beta-1,4-mannosyl-glycoprotein beta-1,4-N-acetylglucosaminyltransferase